MTGFFIGGLLGSRQITDAHELALLNEGLNRFGKNPGSWANYVKHRMMLGYGAPKVERITEGHGRARLTQPTAFASHTSPHEQKSFNGKLK